MIAATLLAPDRYAEWGIALAILGYSVYSNLGLASGLNRELPRLLGEGRVEEAGDVERAALSGSLLTAVLGWPLVAGLGLVGNLSPLMIVSIAVAAGVQQFYLFAQTALRARLRFNRASAQQIVLALAFPAVAVPMISLVGVAGLAIAQILAFAIGAAFSGKALFRPDWSGVPGRLARLSRIGVPIMLGGLLFAVVTTLDRWLVLTYLGDEATGQYTLAALIGSGALLLSMVLAQQFYPRMAHALGGGASQRQLFRMGMMQTAAAVLLVGPLALALLVLAPEIARIAPTYASSADALRVLAIGFLPLVASSGAANFLVVTGHPRRYLSVLVGAIGTEVLLASQLTEFGLVGVALAAACAYGYLLLGASIMAIRVVNR